MTKRNRKPKKSLHHGLVERELRVLHEKGAAVEHQRNLIRTVLNAVVAKYGGKIDVSKEDFEYSGGGNVELEELPDKGIRIIFTAKEGAKIVRWSRLRYWWRSFLSFFRFWRKPAVKVDVATSVDVAEATDE
jgi:hypothetical protein